MASAIARTKRDTYAQRVLFSDDGGVTYYEVNTATPLPVILGTGAALIGSVTANQGSKNANGVANAWGVQGALAPDAAISTLFPVVAGSRASAATPTPVSTDGDVVPDWGDLYGAKNIRDAYVRDPVNDGMRVLDSVVSVRPVITTTTAGGYVQYDNVGGILNTGAIAYQAGAPVQLRGINLTDNLGQNVAMSLDFWDSSPAGTFTDSAKAVPTDLSVHLLRVEIAAGDWKWFSDPAALKSCVSINWGDEGPMLTPAASTIYVTITLPSVTVPVWAANATTLRATLSFRKQINA